MLSFYTKHHDEKSEERDITAHVHLIHDIRQIDIIETLGLFHEFKSVSQK